MAPVMALPSRRCAASISRGGPPDSPTDPATRSRHRSSEPRSPYLPSRPKEAQRLDAILKGVRPYDLRHSYLTMTYLASEDVHATQKMGQHSDPRMTNRYTLAAVDLRLKAAAERLAQMLPPLK
jgi:integrase